MPGPDPNAKFPIPDYPQVCFLRGIVTRPNIVVGEYSYCHSFGDPTRFEDERVLYHFPELGDKLIIGRYCALAHGATFLMNGANHQLSGISTYPFWKFGGTWEEVATPAPSELSFRGDTVIGHDVWIGYEALIMPGVTIGNGAIIAARAVVTSDVPPYTIVGGNSARVIKQRFSDEQITALERIAWWDWPAERVTQHLPLITAGDVAALAKVAATESGK